MQDPNGPFAGHLDADAAAATAGTRYGDSTTLRAALDDAGVTLGAHDERIVEWLTGWERSTIQTVVGWINRARTQ